MTGEARSQSKELKPLFTLHNGVYVWGWALVVWLVFLLVAMLAGGVFSDAPPWVDLYNMVKDNNGVCAAITAVLGVIWGWFVKLRIEYGKGS